MLSTEHGRNGLSGKYSVAGLLEALFRKAIGAHLVHKPLKTGCLCAIEGSLSDSKQMKRGVYEQGGKNWQAATWV